MSFEISVHNLQCFQSADYTRLSSSEKLEFLLKAIQNLLDEMIDIKGLESINKDIQYSLLFDLYELTEREAKVLNIFHNSLLTLDKKVLTNELCEKVFLFLYYLIIKSKHLALPEIFDELDQWQEDSVYDYLYGWICKIDLKNKILYIRLNHQLNNLVKFVFDVKDYNDMFTSQIEELVSLKCLLPIGVMCIATRYKEGLFYSVLFVLEPDYLIDVTAVAENFEEIEDIPIAFLLNKMTVIGKSPYILVGKIINELFDKLVGDIDLEYNTILKDLFVLDPLHFALYTDEEMKSIFSSIKNHFSNLKQCLKTEFIAKEIELDKCYIEPSFYSNKFGLQGRLDLLSEKDNNSYSIVELKSGKPYKVNQFKLNTSHYIQTLLYDLLIRSAYGKGVKLDNYILYSSQEKMALRRAPGLTDLQKRALWIRNRLLLCESRFLTLSGTIKLFENIKQNNGAKLSGFQQNNFKNLTAILHSLDQVEYSYLCHFVFFIGQLARFNKLGTHRSNRGNEGMAQLWLSTRESKIENYSLLDRLVIIENKSGEIIPTMILACTEDSPLISKFRKGDVVVLYVDNNISPLSNQIFKCTIIKINDKTVHIKLRSKQINQTIFLDNKFFAIEPDILDSSVQKMNGLLFEFFKVSTTKRNLILGRTIPQSYDIYELELSHDLTDRQIDLVKKMYFATDYFLLWGPPGTGKTSVVLRELVYQILLNTSQRVLLLSFTNRAVDEMTEAISSFADDQILRIGSVTSIDAQFHKYLLSKHVEKAGNRQNLIKILEDHRVIMATVASIHSQLHLTEILDFDVVIIDEASQILEPSIVGLLSKVKKFILIGDHKQLPAVVPLDPAKFKVSDAKLTDIGLNCLSNSLFERLFKLAMEMSWDHCYGMLTAQGRMHTHILDFVSKNYYDGKLSCIKSIKRLNNSSYIDLLNNYNIPYLGRCIFYDCNIGKPTNSMKTNDDEALLLVHILKSYIPILDQISIGVITPFRSQISKINGLILAAGISLENITVDTVERYQGGARDLIIISAAINHLNMVKGFQSMNDQNINRKLNVALTRAKEQIIFLGNEKILGTVPEFACFINYCKNDVIPSIV